MWTKETIKITDEDIILHHSYTENTEANGFLPHYHEKCELVFLVSGEVAYVVEGKTYRLKKCDVVVSRPMQIHTIGTTVDFIPTARPEMMLVPEPVWDCSAIFFTDP